MKKKMKMKVYTFDEIKDEFLGKVGTKERDEYEHELRLELLGDAIKEARLKRNLTQAQLGKLVGVQKAQISKLENSMSDARIETILKVFTALKAKITFNVELMGGKFKVA